MPPRNSGEVSDFLKLYDLIPINYFLFLAFFTSMLSPAPKSSALGTAVKGHCGSRNRIIEHFAVPAIANPEAIMPVRNIVKLRISIFCL